MMNQDLQQRIRELEESQKVKRSTDEQDKTQLMKESFKNQNL